MVGRFHAPLLMMLSGLAGPLAGQTGAPSSVGLRGMNFVVARHTVGGSTSLYVGQRIGRGILVGGGTRNPRTRNHAVVLGGGTQLAAGRGIRLTAIAAFAEASDGSSLRLYLLPRIVTGRVSVTATASAYQPVGGDALAQASINPATVVYRISRRVKAGGAVALDAVRGRRGRAGAGPTIQVRLPRGELSLEAIASREKRELRLGFSSSW
jgi:hypothetical protein